MGKLYPIQRGEVPAQLRGLAVGSNTFATGETSLIVARSRVPFHKALLRSFSVGPVLGCRYTVEQAGSNFFSPGDKS